MPQLLKLVEVPDGWFVVGAHRLALERELKTGLLERLQIKLAHRIKLVRERSQEVVPRDRWKIYPLTRREDKSHPVSFDRSLLISFESCFHLVLFQKE
jgi:hypothetical protein